MAQRPKEHVRSAIVEAASRELAEVGWEAATIAAIAARAGVSVGNVYKYFAGKEALFAATVPDPVVRNLRQLFRERVRSLAGADPGRLDAGHAYHAAADALMTFSLANRREILFLLHHAADTKHASFRVSLERDLTAAAIAWAARASPGLVLSPPERRALRRIYAAFVSTLAALLEAERSDAAVREAAELHVTYHLSGLRAFFAAARTKEKR